MSDIQNTEAQASLTADIRRVVDEVQRMPKNGAGTTEDYRPVATAFMAAVDHHRGSGILTSDREGAMTLWNCGYSLILDLEYTQGIDPQLMEGVWNCYEALSQAVGIDLQKLYTEGLEKNGENRER